LDNLYCAREPVSGIPMLVWPASMKISGLFVMGAAMSSALLMGESDYRRSGDDHFYNLEYDAAIADFVRLIAQNPADPISYNRLASAELYREMYRLGLLDSSALGPDDRFLRDQRAQADPSARSRFLDALERGRRTAERALGQDPRSKFALYALCTDYALRATYDFMVDKSWFSALRNGSKARGYCDQARKLDPQFIDAYLVLGVFEYTAGSLAWPIKLLTAMGGLHGTKERGIEYVARVAQDGRDDRDAARVLLAVLYHREKHPERAAQILEALMTEYPRNYIFGLELATMYAEAEQPERALGVLKMLVQKAEQNAAGYGRLPREIVQRKIEALEIRQLASDPADASRAWR